MSALLRPSGALMAYVGGQKEIAIETGHTVREVLTGLKIPPEVVALVVVNEEPQTKDYLIEEGDIIRVLAVIGGG